MSKHKKTIRDLTFTTLDGEHQRETLYCLLTLPLSDILTLTLKTQSTVLFLTANNLHSGRLRKQRRFSLLIKGKAVRPFARTNEKSPENFFEFTWSELACSVCNLRL